MLPRIDTCQGVSDPDSKEGFSTRFVGSEHALGDGDGLGDAVTAELEAASMLGEMIEELETVYEELWDD